MSRHLVLAVVALAIALPAGVGPGLAGATATDSVQSAAGSPVALTEVDLTPTATEILEDTSTTAEGTASPTATAQPTDDDLLEDETDEVEDTVDDTVNETDELEDTVDETEEVEDVVDETDGVTSTLTGMLQGAAVSADGSLDVDGLVGVEADLNATTTPDGTPTPAASGAGSTTAAGAPSSDDGGDAPVDPVVGGALLGGVAVAGLFARQLATGATTPGSSGLLARSWARVRLEVAESAAGFRDRVGPLLGPFGYQRYDDSDPLEHDGRARLYEHVRDRPGTHLAALCEAAGLPLSTARYHLRVLQHEGLVRGEKHGGRRRFFPPGVDSDELAAALADEAPGAVLRSLVEDGPASVSELAERLDRDPSTVTHHLERLAGDGLVERERRGRAVVSSVSPSVEAALDREGLAERAPSAANA